MGDQARLVEVVGRAGQHDLAVAHDGHPVGDLEDLVQAVGHVDHADAGLGEAAHHPVQLLDLLVRERGARLVEHQQARVHRHAAGDHDHALVGDAQAADLGLGVDALGAEPVEHLAHLGPQAAPVEPDAQVLGVAQAQLDVLGHRQLGDVGELLVHERQPQLGGVVGVVDLGGLAVDQHLALVGLGRPGQDLDQGALAGAVLPDQAHDLAGRERALGVVQRDHAGVALDQPLVDDQRGARAHVARCPSWLTRTATIRIAPWTRLTT